MRASGRARAIVVGSHVTAVGVAARASLAALAACAQRRVVDATTLVRESWRAPDEPDARLRTILAVAETCARRASDDALDAACRVREAWQPLPGGAVVGGVAWLAGAAASRAARAAAFVLVSADVLLHLSVTEDVTDEAAKSSQSERGREFA